MFPYHDENETQRTPYVTFVLIALNVAAWVLVQGAGGRMEDVAKTTVYITDIKHREAVGRVRAEFFKGDPPANTLVVISALADPALLVEIEAIVPLPG